MPRSKSTPARSSGPKTTPATSIPQDSRATSLRDRADALYRAALECCRQHERYSRCVISEVEAGEERAVSQVVGLCDQHVRAALEAYERAAASDAGTTPQDDWHRSAHALWLASRDWVRRHAESDASSRRLTRHTPERLGELAVEYEFEASALLALQHALATYRKAAPEAELNGNGRPPAPR